ncbi:MAG: alpha/beta hydrolase [Myxococcales bacterium]|nr:alpha/beta hydrolase [Myxococcales bacterium]
MSPSRISSPPSAGPSPLASPTLGGAQLWADRRYRDGWRVQEHVWTGQHRLLDPWDRRRARGPLERCIEALDAHAPPHDRSASRVLLLHGLGRSRRSLAPLSRRLVQEGHECIGLDYPSTRRPLGSLVRGLDELLGALDGEGSLHIVTHSLGGIVARALLATPRVWMARHRPHRLVMLAPPSRGSSLASALRISRFARLVFGPVMPELAELEALPPPPIPFGIIAGSLRARRGLNPLLEGDDDGVVSVRETRLPGAADFLLVEALHTFIMREPRVLEAVPRFLAHGVFA